MIASRLNRIVERSGLQISILINNMSTTKDEKQDEKTLLRKAISRVQQPIKDLNNLLDSNHGHQKVSLDEDIRD